ncbi:MAG: coniferyl aldehyde dehydrogenase [Reyranella sp.]|uniref:coniferyl aldehyde dehydrogenase n=1 Tax=Reyranella sp. TaxID=1929291 RepID=UPI003D126C46
MPSSPSPTAIVAELNGLLSRQKAAQLRDGSPSAAIRVDRLDRCIALLVDHREAIEQALDADFGARSRAATAFGDIASSIAPLKHARAHVARWMRSERRPTTPPMARLLGARAEIRHQPKGVVGVISPWNFPVNLTFAPLAGVLAAGNRAMIKPSETTPETSDLLGRMVAKAFDPEELAVVTGGPDVGRAFAGLAFDHLVFTGGTAIGRQVMRAAAENLVPLTLELGGKSPVVIGRSADLDIAAARIMNGKTFNAGQVCLAPDYVLAPADRVDAFADAARLAVARMFPTLRDNPDVTAIVSDRHHARLAAHLEDARARGARIIAINPASEDLVQQPHRRMAPTLILDPTDDMTVMQEEVFGPLLPVMPYRDIDEAIAYINARPRPLGLYYFGTDETERDHVLSRTVSGGVTVNDVVMHVAQEDLPFGGIGPAGMGVYHGRDGFLEFSHRKSVYHQIGREIGPLRMLRPPFGPRLMKFLATRIRR